MKDGALFPNIFLIKHHAFGGMYGIRNSTIMKRKGNYLLAAQLQVHSVKDSVSLGL